MRQRFLSAVLLVAYTLFCLVCLSWSADPIVRTLKSTFFYLLSPASLPILSEMDQWGEFGRHAAQLIRLDQNFRDLQDRWQKERLDEKKLRSLEQENQRLATLLTLPPMEDFVPLAARVWARDSNDWFHSLLANRGKRDAVKVGDPVVALHEGREVLVGQVIEVFEGTCRVLLVTDPLFTASAALTRTGEQGAVEGMGADQLEMNYLFSDSDVLIGDEVVTAGLGRVFPPGISLGQVREIGQNVQGSFKKIGLKPSARLGFLEDVIILCRSEALSLPTFEKLPQKPMRLPRRKP